MIITMNNADLVKAAINIHLECNESMLMEGEFDDNPEDYIRVKQGLMNLMNEMRTEDFCYCRSYAVATGELAEIIESGIEILEDQIKRWRMGV